jgi:ribosomal protein L7/L12
MKYTTLAALRLITVEQLADVALKMAESHPATFTRLLMEAVPEVPVTVEYLVPNSTERVRFDQKQLKVLNAFGEGDKVPCIKQIREFTCLGLKEAKDLCEAMFPRYNISRF